MSARGRASGRESRKDGPMGNPFGGGMAPAEKAKDFKGTLRRLIGYLKPHSIKLLAVLVAAIISVIFSIVGPKVLSRVTDNLVTGYVQSTVYTMVHDLLPEGVTVPEGTTVKDLVDILAAFRDLPEGADRQSMMTGLPPQLQQVVGGLMQRMAENSEVSAQTTEIDLDSIPESYRNAVLEVDLGGAKPGIDFNTILDTVLLLIALYVASALFSWIQQFTMAGVSQDVVKKMRTEVDYKLSRLPLKYYDGRTHGEILSRVTNDVDTVAQTLQQSLTQLVTAIVTIVGVLIMMLSISPFMTLVALISIPMCLVVTMFIIKRSQKYFVGQQRALGELNGHVEEMFTGHKVIKAYGRERKSTEKFMEANDQVYNYNFKAQFVSGVIMPLMIFINNIGYVFVAVIGGLRVASGRLSIGDIQAFIQYSNQFSQPINQTANISNIIQSTVAAAERVFEVLDETEMSEDPAKPAVLIPNEVKGYVEFEDVDFSYTPEKPLIEGMNISLKPGQTVAIVGPTGAGKTTIVNLLMRFYEIESGKIRIDGVDTSTLTRNNLRSVFGMVLQDTWLFKGSIKDNIAYGRPDATFEEIVAAAKAARIDHYVRTLPDGYETNLNEEASDISQGQKQLLTIARAMLADPTILILDEATSSVDTRTEIQIQKAMNRLMQGRTSFVIAHRLSTIRDADMILVMNEGHIIETGTHSELVEKVGFYADLYNSQFTGKQAG